ncbi:glutathione synthase [Yunchengibacter salinarum]|uniref:glutathione synthase n=1 Tax=Yunchengibacter salinarum TaxID=3133399 RepID=UPI0035B58924
MTATNRRVAIQMDPMENINIDGDSTFVLALEAQARGHALWHYLPGDLSYREGRVVARARPLTVQREKGSHFTYGPVQTLDLETDLDVILMRQDPPFDMSYIAATHLLDMVHPKTLVVNDPTHVRNAPEKLFTLMFRDLMPETLITRSLDEIREFRARHGEIILKPLFGKGGEGVFHLDETDSNLASLLEMFTLHSREPVMVQRFLKEVRGGDKRIILVDGEPAGAVNRVPADGEVRSNLVVGGRAEKSSLTDRELEICRTIGPDLKKRGLIFVGIDVIGGWLTEINVTSPTGLQSINGFDGVRLEADIWTAIERKLEST